MTIPIRAEDRSLAMANESIVFDFTDYRLWKDKAQCQLSKRLAGPIILLSWAAINHFPVYLAIFGMTSDDTQLTNKTNNLVIQEQA